jgi:hypothetical protein
MFLDPGDVRGRLDRATEAARAQAKCSREIERPNPSASVFVPIARWLELAPAIRYRAPSA